MSVFSRIFQKNPTRDSKRPEGDETEAKEPKEPKANSTAPKPSNRAPAAEAKPSTAPRRSMRPVAPPLEMRSERPPKTSVAPAQPAAPSKPAPTPAKNSKSETTLVYASPPTAEPVAPPSVPRPQAPPAPSAARPPAPPKAGPPPTTRATLPTVPERAKAAAKKPAAAPPKVDEIDAAFGALVDKGSNGKPREPRVEAPAAPPPDVRELFVAIAANHMRPLRDVMIGIKWGDAMPGPAAICSPIVSSLMSAASQMGFTELTQGLGTFAGVLNRKAGGEGTLDASAREEVLAAYAKLSSHMPDVFALEGEQGRREAVIVHALLRQIPEVSHLAMQRLYAAGLANLDMMLLAKADALTSIAGVETVIASRIVDKFASYRRETRDASAGANREKERERLTALAAELRRLHKSHEQAAAGWGDDATEAKKKLRHARNEAFMQVKVLLARLGELDRLRELETMSFQSRIDRLEAYLLENGTPTNNGGRG
jgi:hypothetical protein